MNSAQIQEIIACVIGIIIGGVCAYFVLGTTEHHHNHDDTHPIANPYDNEYHVHADFLIYVDNELLDLSGDEYMTTAAQKLSEHAHLHDNNGDVMHIHAEGITFVSFLDTIGITLTDSCLTTPDGTEHCMNNDEVLRLYVNGEVTDDVDSYVPVDDDRVLLYYGTPDSPQIPEYLETIPHDSCYYSGTCPERGVAPPESCGLTCEL